MGRRKIQYTFLRNGVSLFPGITLIMKRLKKEKWNIKEILFTKLPKIGQKEKQAVKTIGINTIIATNGYK